jgi:hypothetical protein
VDFPKVEEHRDRLRSVSDTHLTVIYAQGFDWAAWEAATTQPGGCLSPEPVAERRKGVTAWPVHSKET